MDWVWILATVVAGVNFLLLLSMVFLEKRSPQNIAAWMMVLTFLPIIGFILYVIFGSGLSIRTRRMIKNKALHEYDIVSSIDGISKLEQAKVTDVRPEDRELIALCYSSGAVPLPGNSVQIFNWGKDKLRMLKRDLKNAKVSINIEYYIFAKDKTGKEIMEILCKKAREGVKVKLIYDSVGSRKAPRRFFKQLEKAGGKVGEFFPPFAHIRAINLKVNYRNHRKIVVIDGQIGYTGGINIRDDHMGLDKKLSPWRDTSVRIEGSGAYALQNIFLDDWRYCKNDNTPHGEYLMDGSFPPPSICGDTMVQVVSSGPDSAVQKVKEVFVKMVASAKERVYIQTPYFVPDEVFMSAIRIAVKSGVDVRIMVPALPDKKSVWLVTLSYLKEVQEIGAKVYLYNGFLHSKAMLVDGNKLAIGTCNMDNRSFALNFENTAIMFSENLNAQYLQAFRNDCRKSYEVGASYFKRKRWITKMLQAIFRLLSPLF